MRKKNIFEVICLSPNLWEELVGHKYDSAIPIGIPFQMIGMKSKEISLACWTLKLSIQKINNVQQFLLQN